MKRRIAKLPLLQNGRYSAGFGSDRQTILESFAGRGRVYIGCMVVLLAIAGVITKLGAFAPVADSEIVDVFSSSYTTEQFSEVPISHGQIDSAGASSKTIGWGLVRSGNNQPPRFDETAKALLEKYDGICLGDTTRKVLYLTFDEGYENGYTPKILDVLKENNVKAAFFITGPYLKNHQDLVRRMVEEGHIVGNHTINHPSLPSLDESKIEQEVVGLDRVFQEKFNRNMTFLRPPRGEFNERTLEITRRLGYRNVMWSFAYDDWDTKKQRDAKYAYDIVMKNIHPGAVILLHAVSKDNADALDSIIKDAKAQGYVFESLDSIK